uniref:Uncharacterized protein n=1 Tax=Globodera rostochiensis TaxID=31243 RepID=A0A914HU45_GLORO
MRWKSSSERNALPGQELELEAKGGSRAQKDDFPSPSSVISHISFSVDRSNKGGYKLEYGSAFGERLFGGPQGPGPPFKTPSPAPGRDNDVYNNNDYDDDNDYGRKTFVPKSVLESPAFDGRFFGYRAEWGCIESKASLLANLNESDGWKGKQFIGSTCNPYYGTKHTDMSNHNIYVPIFNTSVLSSLWCKGGHFWMGNQQKNVTVCQKHQHYCYAVNCRGDESNDQKGKNWKKRRSKR